MVGLPAQMFSPARLARKLSPASLPLGSEAEALCCGTYELDLGLQIVPERQQHSDMENFPALPMLPMQFYEPPPCTASV
eukprot:1146321-Pelagomonas_calceolata.AAC.7